MKEPRYQEETFLALLSKLVLPNGRNNRMKFLFLGLIRTVITTIFIILCKSSVVEFIAFKVYGDVDYQI